MENERVILDTNIIVGFLRGKSRYVHFMNNIEKQYRLSTTTINTFELLYGCLLYTSDAADEGLGVDLGGRRIIKKKIILN